MTEKTALFFKERNIIPKDTSIYDLALTHPSCNNENNTKHQDYERLEFIGDSVIGFVTADIIFKTHPNLDQGVMSKLRSHLVCSKSLASLARQVELFKYINIGHSITQEQLKKSDKILEDVFEAVTGAIYLDLGLEVASKYLHQFFQPLVDEFDPDDIIDPKTKLQEDIQAEYRDSVRYNLEDEYGPAHDRTFVVSVSFNNIVLGKGIGKSKKAAEEAAARDALSKRSI